jgi:hypothetical protein
LYPGTGLKKKRGRGEKYREGAFSYKNFSFLWSAFVDMNWWKALDNYKKIIIMVIVITKL